MTNSEKCGHIAIIGRTNVGKSTLINKLLKKNISITTKKINTTISCINGIKTKNNNQMIFIDTPGPILNNKQNNNILSSILESNIILFVIEVLKIKKEDLYLFDMIKNTSKLSPIILIINKIDKLKMKDKLLPFIFDLSKRFNFHKIIPISAKNNIQINNIEHEIIKILPDKEHIYKKNIQTTSSRNFKIKETIREQLIKNLYYELPYVLKINIDYVNNIKKIIIIHASIIIKKYSQKIIILGKNGEKFRKINMMINKNLEKIFRKKIYIKIIIKK